MRNLKLTKSKWALISGAMTLILFAAKPYILDLIEPSKSLGRIIGENARDLADALNNGGHNEKGTNSKREIWSNIFIIAGFIFIALTMFLSLDLLRTESKWFGIGAIALAVIGLVVFVVHLSIGLVAFLLISILVVVIVMGGGS